MPSIPTHCETWPSASKRCWSLGVVVLDMWHRCRRSCSFGEITRELSSPCGRRCSVHKRHGLVLGKCHQNVSPANGGQFHCVRVSSCRVSGNNWLKYSTKCSTRLPSQSLFGRNRRPLTMTSGMRATGLVMLVQRT